MTTISLHRPVGEKRFKFMPHGWVVEREDKMRARCGGPGYCEHCKAEQAALDAGHWPYEEPRDEQP